MSFQSTAVVKLCPPSLSSPSNLTVSAGDTASICTPPPLGNAWDLAKKHFRRGRKGKSFPRICGWNRKERYKLLSRQHCDTNSIKWCSVFLEPLSPLFFPPRRKNKQHDTNIQFTLQPCFPRDQLVCYSHHLGLSMGAIGERRMSTLWLLKSLSIQPVCYNACFLPSIHWTNIRWVSTLCKTWC